MKIRLLAMLLVVSMVAGMVPATTFASGSSSSTSTNLDDVLPNILVDSFGDDRYTDGTLYKWTALDYSTTFSKTLLERGYFNLTNMAPGQTNKNFISNYLTAINMVTGEDYAQNWSNYSVEMNYRVDTFDPVIEGDQETTDALSIARKKGTMLVMGRVQHHADGSATFYAGGFQYADPDHETNYDKVTKFILYKGMRYGAADGYKVTLTSLGGATVNFSLDTFHTVKLSFVDNKIEAFVDGECLVTAEDNDYTAGSVGFMLNRCGSMAINSLKVVHEDDISTFVDEFSDSRYVDGAVYKWTPDNDSAWQNKDGVLTGGAAGNAGVEYDPVAVASKWNIQDMYPQSVTRGDISATGMLSFVNASAASTEKNYVTTYLTLASDDGEQTANWTNYAVEAGLKLSDGNAQTKLGLMGRVQIDKDGNGTYYAAGIRYNNNAVYLYKGTI